MWWKILIAVVCAVLLISPIDALPGLPFDDIIYGLGMVSTLLTTFKGMKGKKGEENIKDVNDN